MYKVVDVFTARDGNLDPNGDPRQYGITKAMMDKYGDELQGKGCATCIFVKLEGGTSDTVYGVTTDGYAEEPKVAQDRWAHINMYNPGSGYNPDNNKGPWSVRSKFGNSEVVTGIGLPYGWHVTTYVVFKWEDGALPGPDPEPEPEPTPDPEYPLYITFQFGGEMYEGYVRKVS